MTLALLIYRTNEKISQLREKDSAMAAIEREIPGWQEGSLAYIRRRREGIRKSIAEEQTRLSTAEYVRNSSALALDCELADSKRRLAITPVTQFTLESIEKQRRALAEMEWMVAMKKAEEMRKEGGTINDDAE